MEDENENNTKNENENNNNSNNQNNSIIQISNSSIVDEKAEKKIIERMSDLLSDICDDNINNYNNEKNPNIKPFLSRNIPSISIKDYLERLYKYSKINSSTIILILVYIDRLCNIYKFKLTYFNIHKLILASMIIAIKYNEDEYYSIKFYAKLGGISKSELLMLEYHFISLLKYNLFVNKELYNKYYDYVSSADSDEEDNYNNNDNSSNSDDNINNNNNNEKNNNNFINDNNDKNNNNQKIKK